MARSLKGYRKIVVDDKIWYWKIQHGYYVWLYLYCSETAKMRRMYCDNHYHKEDGTIVNISIKPSIVSHIIKNDIKDITPELLYEFNNRLIRSRKLERILK